MSDRSNKISKLLESATSRASYIRAKLNINIPSQIRGIRRRREWTQAELAEIAAMKQSRISAIESPGAVKFNIETLIRLAAAFRVGLQVKFVPFSEMVQWENEFSQDTFEVTKIENDIAFINPDAVTALRSAMPDFLSNLTIPSGSEGMLIQKLMLGEETTKLFPVPQPAVGVEPESHKTTVLAIKKVKWGILAARNSEATGSLQPKPLFH